MSSIDLSISFKKRPAATKPSAVFFLKRKRDCRARSFLFKEVLHCCGASAVSQAIKAIAVARGFLASGGRDAVVRPGFDSTIIDGEDRTIIKLFISLV